MSNYFRAALAGLVEQSRKTFGMYEPVRGDSNESRTAFENALRGAEALLALPDPEPETVSLQERQVIALEKIAAELEYLTTSDDNHDSITRSLHSIADR